MPPCPADAGREGCCVSTLTITSEPKDWEGAITVALEETTRLQQHGITRGELERYVDALLRDSEQLSNQADSTPSIDQLNYVMESMALGHQGEPAALTAGVLASPTASGWHVFITLFPCRSPWPLARSA